MTGYSVLVVDDADDVHTVVGACLELSGMDGDLKQNAGALRQALESGTMRTADRKE